MKHSALILILSACSVPASQSPETLRRALTPERVATLQTPIMLVSLPELGVAATLVPVGQNGEVVTWRARDGVTVAFRDGVLTATRGLGHDLMATDAGIGNQHRQHYLDGSYRTEIVTWSCQPIAEDVGMHSSPSGSVPVTTVFEECKANNQAITNVYKRSLDGTLWWSRQWVGPRVGHIETELIRS